MSRRRGDWERLKIEIGTDYKSAPGLSSKKIIMFSEAFLNRIKSQNYIDSESLLKALGEPSPVSIRVNPSKWGRVPANSEPVPWSSSGYYLGERPSYTLDPLFHSGCYYPQEASGMFLEQAVKQAAPSPNNIRVLDLCGAPGGKSLLLSDLLGPDSFLVSNEVIRQRASVLAETVTKWGHGNTLVTQSDPAQFGNLPGFFDIILVDAPCSGEGMFRTDIAVSEWSVANTAHCAERQKRIIMDVWPALKENGILIYSTCTFNPGENEENIRWLTGQKKAECVMLDINGFEGIAEIDFNGICGYGFYPGRTKGEGFFISVIRKKDNAVENPFRERLKAEFKPTKIDLEMALKWSDFAPDRLLRPDDDIFALPCDRDVYMNLFSRLNIVKPGTRLFSVRNKDYLPSHELALSACLRKDAFPLIEAGSGDSLSYLQRNTFPIEVTSKGWKILTFKGVNLGFINNLGSRFNNYFPVEWRIRMNLPAPGDYNIIEWESDGATKQ
jgi:16S rRNA C967 or C1407 C5-methylase (RsmB/RsmF family)/NOL1/NOP2/fmu family ribosome biogenesis protein